MAVPVIALLVMIGLGILMIVSPKTCTRADKRDDPEAVESIRKGGYAVIGIGLVAGLYFLKYALR